KWDRFFLGLTVIRRNLVLFLSRLNWLNGLNGGLAFCLRQEEMGSRFVACLERVVLQKQTEPAGRNATNLQNQPSIRLGLGLNRPTLFGGSSFDRILGR